MKVDAATRMNETVVLGPSPWGVPGGLGVYGTRNQDEVETASIVFESPLEIFHAPEGISKEDSERIQLERLRTDIRLQGATLPFGSVVRGPDLNKPPDFLISLPRSPEKWGLDVTRLSITERMTGQALFRRLRQTILARPREEFEHLIGSVVYLWFDQDGFSSLPPKQDDAVDALLDALREYEFDPELTLQDISSGEQLGDIGRESSGKGAHFYAVPMTSGTPSSFFYLCTGFELGLGFQTTHDAASAWSSITRLIESHDNPETQILVISVGAPDRHGLSYPSETFLKDFSLAQPAPEISPVNLKEVYLHSWPDGAVGRVHPVIDCMAPPLYVGGFLPAHFSLVPAQVEMSDTLVEATAAKPR